MTKAKFKKGQTVLVNPFGKMGTWACVDSNLNHEGPAKIKEVIYYKPKDAADFSDSAKDCPREGYWEYNLEWFKDKNFRRPKYAIAEPFLLSSKFFEARVISSYYKHIKQLNKLGTQFAAAQALLVLSENLLKVINEIKIKRILRQ
jgi:hypothetical protein